MAFDIEHTVDIVRAAGLHKVAGVMNGVSEMTAPTAMGVIGAKAYARRKEAQLVASGLVSLAVVQKQAMSAETAAKLREIVTPSKKAL